MSLSLYLEDIFLLGMKLSACIFCFHIFKSHSFISGVFLLILKHLLCYNYASFKTMSLCSSYCFWLCYFGQFYYDKARSDFLYILPAWCLGCFLKLWLDVFHEFGEILSHYFFSYCLHPFLSLCCFWDFNYFCVWVSSCVSYVVVFFTIVSVFSTCLSMFQHAFFSCWSIFHFAKLYCIPKLYICQSQRQTIYVTIIGLTVLSCERFIPVHITRFTWVFVLFPVNIQ